MGKIDTSKWEPFKIRSLFTVKRPVARSQSKYDDGDVPFVASGNYNNGVLKYLCPKTGEILDKGNCITVSPIDGSAFYQKNDFLGRGGAGSSIIVLYNDSINEYSGCFIATIIRTVCKKYYYSDMANKDVIAEETILLPVDENHQPDFSYMESYMKNQEIAVSASLTKLQSAKRSLKSRNAEFESWKTYKIKDIFPNIVKPAVYHTREVKENPEGIPYVVRSKFNNGVKYYVERPNSNVNPAKVISFGAENATFFYQKYKWISGRDMYYIDTRGIDEYACLFITSCLQPIAEKYSYNYGMFPDLLKEEKIKLPANENGEPDYALMEKYMKIVESKVHSAVKVLSAV